MVGEIHNSFTMLSVKTVMLFQHCQQVIQVLCTGLGYTEANLSVKKYEILDCCYS
jgi:hypothetical protein